MRRHAEAPSTVSSTRRDDSVARAKLLTLLGACLLCAFVVFVATAGASKGVLTYFGEEGTGDGQFGAAPTGIAVNKTGNGSGVTTGDVYVIDKANQRVEQFSADGDFVRTFGWGVADGSDAFQICESGCQAGVVPTAAGAAGSLEDPQGIAIDQATGNLFIVDRASQRIDVYGSDGTFQGAFGWEVDKTAPEAKVQLCTTASGCQNGVAGSTSGNSFGKMGSAPIAVAVDPTDGGVYVADRSLRRVDHYEVTTTTGVVTGASFHDAFGWKVKRIGAAEEFQTCTEATECQAGGTGEGGNNVGQFFSNQPNDITVDSTGAVYVTEKQQTSTKKRRVEKFTPGGGTYTPEEFAFGATGSESNSTAPEYVAIGASNHVFIVKAFAAGATASCPGGESSPAERRVLELDSSGALEGTDATCAAINSVNGLAVNPTSGRIYMTSSTGGNRVYVLDDVSPPAATMNPVTDAAATTATFSGTVTPNGVPTGYHFEYSADGGASWQRTVFDDIDVGDGAVPVAVESVRTALQPNTTYEARLVAAHPFNAGADTTAPVTFTTAAVPPEVSVAPSVAGRESATLHGLVHRRGSEVSDCRFEWGRTLAYGNSAPCSPSEPDVFEVQRITVAATAGQFKLRIGDVISNDLSFDASASQVRQMIESPNVFPTARVTVTGGPGGTAPYRIAFGGATGRDVPQIEVIDGTTPLTGAATSETVVQGSPALVSADISGLEPGTTYHFRLVAENAAGSAQGEALSVSTTGAGAGCANEGRRIEQHSTALPDCRAYELVSPPDKNGGDIFAESTRSRASADGNAIVFQSLTGFADTVGGSLSSDYMAIRDAADGVWRTHALMPAADARDFHEASRQEPGYTGEFSPDLDKGVFLSIPGRTPLTPDSDLVHKVSNLYLRSNLRTPGPGAFSLVSACPLCLQPPAAELLPAEFEGQPGFAGASSDFSRIAFASTHNLTGDASGNSVKAYEWADGDVRLAGRVPASGNFCDDQTNSPACVPAPRSVPGSSADRFFADRPLTISPDGARITFTVPTGQNESAGDIYLRSERSETAKINASERTTPAAPQPAELWAADPTLTRIFFITAEPLVDSDTDTCADVYSYDAELPASDPHNLLRVSLDNEPSDGLCTAVAAITNPTTSENGKTLYFFSSRRLLPDAPYRPANASLLYRWREGEPLRYVGGISNAGTDLSENVGTSLGYPRLDRISADGDRLLFASYAGPLLTGYDQPDFCGESSDISPQNGRCRELYLYDAEDGAVLCVSCVPDGTRQKGNASTMSRFQASSARPDNHASRALSVDGRFVFFDSADDLLPDDTNGVRDVYRYDVLSGQLNLITTGTSPTGSHFLDASPDGESIFFITRQRLVGSDVDGAYDLYSARVGGGFPEPAAEAAPCLGEAACRGAAPAPPAPSQAASAAVVGPGSPGAHRRRCRRGKRAVRVGGKTRCRKQRRRGNRRRGSKRRHHAKKHGSGKAKRHRNRTANHHRRARR